MQIALMLLSVVIATWQQILEKDAEAARVERIIESSKRDAENMEAPCKTSSLKIAKQLFFQISKLQDWSNMI